MPETNPAQSKSSTGVPLCPLCRQSRIKHLYRRTYRGRTWSLAYCLDCKFHFTDPPPTLTDIQEFYSGNFHEELRQSGAVERRYRSKFERYIQSIRPFVPYGRTLDVGCATGLFPYMLQCAGYDAEGVELNVESAEWGTRHYGIPIQIGTLETLLSDGRQHAYDLVTLTDVLEHTVNPLEGLKFVSGLLKPGGHILVTFPDIRSLKSQIYRLLAKLTGRGWVTCHIPFHTWEFTQTTAVDCFNRAGFSVVAFRRSEPKEDFVERYLRLFLFPMRILSLDILARTLGTQMEFVLRKIEGRNRCT